MVARRPRTPAPRPLALAAACALLAACGGAAAPPPAAPAITPPPLVVLLVIDQLPQWAFAAKRPHLTGGFARLARAGRWHTGVFPSAATLTGPGHALIGSGASPATSGIIANEWWDRGAERVIKSIDPVTVGGPKTAARLRVAGLGDSVAAAGRGGKAVAVALKDRSALLVLGHAGLAVWYEPAAATWASSAPRPWLDAHAAAHPVRARLDEVWTPLDPARLAALSGTVDAQPGEVGEKGFGPTFPHALAATPSPADAVFAAPLGNELVLDTALAALDGEQLGRDATPDLLVVALSAHDYAGHGWGHESWEAWDMALRLDAQLDTFITALDARAPGWAMVVTSDHGAAPLPERVGGGRLRFERVAEVANEAAAAVLGPGTWVGVPKSPYVYLTAAARARPAAEQARALDAIVAALRALPALDVVERTAPLLPPCDGRTEDARALCLMLDPARAGELVFLPRAGWVMEEVEEPVATAHGSLHAYDREVPVLLVPPGARLDHAPAPAPAQRVPMETLAATIAGWLGAPAPATLPPRQGAPP